MGRFGESLSDVISTTLTSEEFDREFDGQEHLPDGPYFTLWTEKRVYFPDASAAGIQCRSVSRNPDGVKTPHMGWPEPD